MVATCKIINDHFDGHRSYWLKDKNSGTSVEILPFLGGAINSYRVQRSNQELELIDGYRGIEEIETELLSSFKGCNLFPFPNRIADGQYNYNHHTHQLQINFVQENNAIHGLLYDKTLHYAASQDGDNACSLELYFTSKGNLEGYPFTFEQRINYTLQSNGAFVCTTTIINTDTILIPVGQGWHPYFTGGAHSIDSLYLTVPQSQIVQVDHRKIPCGKMTPHHAFLQPSRLEGIKLDTCFGLDTGNGRAETILNNPDHNLQMILWQELGKQRYNYLQLYTPPHRNSLAIEPMTCEPNVFNSGRGLIELEPGHFFTTAWGILTRELSTRQYS